MRHLGSLNNSNFFKISRCSLHLLQYHWSVPESNSSLLNALKQESRVIAPFSLCFMSLRWLSSYSESRLGNLLPYIFLNVTPSISYLSCFMCFLISPNVIFLLPSSVLALTPFILMSHVSALPCRYSQNSHIAFLLT